MSNNQYVIALDVGERRIGVALADTTVKLASPLTTLQVNDTEIDQLQQIISQYDATKLVVGYPRNLQGEPTAQTEYIKDFAKKLASLNIEVWFQDESLTSVIAEQRLKAHKKPYSKEDIDAYAAAIILQDYIDNPASATLASAKTDGSKDKQAPKKSKKHPGVMAVSVLLASLITLVALLGGLFYAQLQPRNPHGSQKRITIATGTTPAEIGTQLHKQGVIKSAAAFRLYIRMKGLNNLQAGTYALSPAQSTPDIANHLAQGKVDELHLTIAPGQTLAELKATFKSYGYGDQAINQALSASYNHPLLASKPQNASLEGYIYPETYNLEPTEPLGNLFKRSFDEFWADVQHENLVPQLAERGLSLYQGITLASIVQKEVSSPAEQKQVAQVFLKRLHDGIELGSDVTFIYGANLLGVEPSVGVESPYNTRKHKGLPPGPIANFNLSALTAVAKPASGDYLYFVAGDDGHTYFARTLEEHEANVAKHCHVLCEMF